MSQTSTHLKFEVTCPSCGHAFGIDEAVRKQLEASFSSEREAQIREEYVAREAQLQKLTKAKDEEIIDLRAAKSEATRLRAELDTFKEQRDIEIEAAVEAKLSEKEAAIKRSAEAIALKKAELRSKETERSLKQSYEEKELNLEREKQEAIDAALVDTRLKNAELVKQLSEQKSLVEEMRRKSEQGSQQLQGEVQELELEAALAAEFRFDTLKPVPKGRQGADCILEISEARGRKIIFESKRAKEWSRDWIAKVKADKLNAGCDIAVIVTSAFPKELQRFGQIDGVWVCSLADVIPLATILRDSLVRINAAHLAEENKGEKMSMMYAYLTSNEFSNQVTAIITGFQNLRSQVDDEERVFTAQWARRRKELINVLKSTGAMYGAIQGIAGGAMPKIELLEPVATPRLPEAPQSVSTEATAVRLDPKDLAF